MQSLLLFKPDFSLFDRQKVEHALRLCGRFTDMRFDEPGGALIECRYVEGADWTTIRLGADLAAITLSFAWGAALSATLIIQKSLGIPLRLINDGNSYDFVFSNID